MELAVNFNEKRYFVKVKETSGYLDNPPEAPSIEILKAWDLNGEEIAYDDFISQEFFDKTFEAYNERVGAYLWESSTTT